jgi:Flp pilus assembly protein TadB
MDSHEVYISVATAIIWFSLSGLIATVSEVLGGTPARIAFFVLSIIVGFFLLYYFATKKTTVRYGRW